MTVKLLVRPEDLRKCDQILVEHHYLKNAKLVGEQLRYAVVWKGQWQAVATWSAAALHLKARDKFIGWTEEQRRQRLALVVNNSRLYVLEDCHYPNLVSRFMKLMMALKVVSTKFAPTLMVFAPMARFCDPVSAPIL